MRRAIILLLFLSFAFADSVALTDVSSTPQALTLNQTLGEGTFTTGISLVDNIVSNWQTYSLISLIISFLFGILLYMGGKLLSSRMMALYANMEFQELLASFAIFLLFIASITVLDAFFASSSTNATFNGFIEQNLLVIQKFNTSIANVYYSTLQKIKDNSISSSKRLSFGIDLALAGYPETTQVADPVAYITSQANLIRQRNLSHLQNLYIFATSFKLFFSKLLIPTSILFIIFGIFFRSLFFTRRFGATMIALGIAGYVVFPVLLNYLFTLAGYIVPSTPYLPGPQCPSLCSSPVPTVVNTSNFNPVDARSLLDTLGASSSVPIFKNTTYMAIYNLSLGKLSSASILGSTYYSCDNISWASNADDYYCPSTCRTIPYPDSSTACREYAYSCKNLYETAPNCFKDTSLGTADNSYIGGTEAVPTFSVSNGKLVSTPMDPVAAATKYSCALIQPLTVPTNIPLKDSEGNVLDSAVNNNTYFCSQQYRYAILDLSKPNKVSITLPGKDKEDCDNFYKQALPQGDNLLKFAVKLNALMNPGKLSALALNNTYVEGPLNYKVTSIDQSLPGTSSAYGPAYKGVINVYCQHSSGENLYKCFIDPPAYNHGRGLVKITYDGTLIDQFTGGSFAGYKVYCGTTDNLCGNSSNGYQASHTNQGKTLKAIEVQLYTYNLSVILTSGPFTGTISQSNAKAMMRRSLLDAYNDGGISQAYEKSNSLSGIYSITGFTAQYNCGTKDNPDPSCIAEKANQLVREFSIEIPILVVGNCSKIAAVPSEKLFLPPVADCSKCLSSSRAPLAASLKSNIEGMNFIANAYIKIMLVPTIAIALTAAIVAALSSYLGGEMFIPAIRKVL
ncbi:MAG: hypothetical protein D6769_03495 [Methanobacteriota archaeon]|nr:MAG: hypothetical protein D6769_03495 [Euryarchaeota archaeon]